MPMVLPANFDSMSGQQQMLWLFNSEREARGLADLQLDPTLMSQIALNHDQEMAQYGYFEHPSPINQGQNVFARDSVNPALSAASSQGEDIAEGFGVPEAVFGYMYDDADSQWGHREAILGDFNWVGIGVMLNVPNSQAGNYYTDDFAQMTNYTPPATADTGTPTMGAITYANGTASVSGVADSTANLLDTGPNPATAGITQVSFYTNNISDINGDGSAYNTVPATQTSPGTWSAQITVNPGDVLHAVAVDGSGNYTDMAAPAPAVTLTVGANTVALPAAPAGTGTARDAAAGSVPAIASSAAALVASINRQAHHKVVRFVRVYSNGHWQTYYPGHSANFPLAAGEGVVVSLTGKVVWKPGAGDEAVSTPVVHLHRGWNFVSAPYPTVGMTCHAVRFELARKGDRLLEISIGASPNTGVIMKPHHGSWGNDLLAHIPYQKGFWVDDTGSADWTPSPVNWATSTPHIK